MITQSAGDDKDGPSKQQAATIVFFSMDALGHIQPILSIAKELRRRGHRPVILTTRPLSFSRQLIEKGFELESCEEQPDKLSASASSNSSGSIKQENSDDVLRAIMEPIMNEFRKGPKAAFESTYKLEGAAGKHLNDMIAKHDLIAAKMESLKPDIIVYDHIIGIPCATQIARRWVRVYSGFPSAIFSCYNDNFVAGQGLTLEQMTSAMKQDEIQTRKLLREKVRQFWKSCGSTIDWDSPIDLLPVSDHLNFYLGPQELGLDNIASLKPLPKCWFRLEHTIDDIPAPIDLPTSISHGAGKLIYFSLGTLVTADTQLINRLLEILSHSPNRFIVSMGQMHKHIKLYPNMWGDRFVDQLAILQRANLFISHGGHNSIIEAFYFGVPMLILPVFADQFDSAQRIQDCSLGGRLNPFECSKDLLLATIDSLLANDQLQKQMSVISARLKTIKYNQMAADKLEDLLRE